MKPFKKHKNYYNKKLLKITIKEMKMGLWHKKISKGERSTKRDKKCKRYSKAAYIKVHI
jgi:hypothetical protein